MLLDEQYGREAMFAAARQNFWIGRPVELPGSRPLRFEGSGDIGSRLIEWPVTHTVKCLAFYHPRDEDELRSQQRRRLRGLYEAVRRIGRELLIEIIAGRHGAIGEETVAQALAELYSAGIKPDWWKLEPQKTEAAWRAIEDVIGRQDPWCRGILLLGLEAPARELETAFALTEGSAMVKGFAIGRTIFNHAAESWFAGKMSDEEAISEMAEKFDQLTVAWQRLRGAEAA
jgi:5-dehydro-2-deoxygluconokinase